MQGRHFLYLLRINRGEEEIMYDISFIEPSLLPRGRLVSGGWIS